MIIPSAGDLKDTVNEYNITGNKVSFFHQSIYIGESSLDDTDWLNKVTVFINEYSVFDYKKYSHGPEKIDEDLVVKVAINSVEDMKTREIVKTYNLYSRQLERMSALQKFFNKKTYMRLSQQLRVVEGKYLEVQNLIESKPILEEFLKQSESKKQSSTEQPFSS